MHWREKEIRNLQYQSSGEILKINFRHGIFCSSSEQLLLFQPCDPSAPAFRAVQCSEFNKKKVKDDGLHTWTPYTKDKSKLCSLKCINEKKIYMELARVVKDGTSCKAGTNNMCISGVCRVIIIITFNLLIKLCRNVSISYFFYDAEHWM